MDDNILPKPTGADLLRLRELEKEENGGAWSAEYVDQWNSFDWSPELIVEGDKCGLKNAFGEMILPVEFEDVKLLSSTLVETGGRVVAMQDGKWGVVLADLKGTWLIKPEFEYIGFPNNITHVRKGGLWGVMDISKGVYLIAPECEHVDDSNGFMFVNGMASYKKDGLWGVICADGSFTEAAFEDVELEPEEWVKVKYKGEWGYIDENTQFTLYEDEAYYTMDMD